MRISEDALESGSTVANNHSRSAATCHCSQLCHSGVTRPFLCVWALATKRVGQHSVARPRQRNPPQQLYHSASQQLYHQPSQQLYHSASQQLSHVPSIAHLPAGFMCCRERFMATNPAPPKSVLLLLLWRRTRLLRSHYYYYYYGDEPGSSEVSFPTFSGQSATGYRHANALLLFFSRPFLGTNSVDELTDIASLSIDFKTTAST